MPDDILPPSTDDDDSSDVGAFDEFVNEHLDLTDLDTDDAPQSTTPSQHPFQRPFASPGPRRFQQDDGDNLDNALDDDDPFDDSDSLSGRKPFSLFGPPRPSTTPSQLWRPGGGGSGRPGSESTSRPPFGSPSSGSQTPPVFGAPPRSPFPPIGDPRWVNGRYRVADDLEIYSPPSVFSLSRVTVIPNAGRRWDKRIQFIKDVAPGWSAVRLVLHPGRMPVTGYVRNSSVTLLRSTDWRDHILELADAKISLIDVIVLICAVLLIFSVVTQITRPDTAAAPTDDRMNALETQTAAQEARIDELEYLLNSTRR